MAKSYWALIDTPEFSESVRKPITNTKNPFPELAAMTKDRSKLGDFKKQEWVAIVFYDIKAQRDEAAEWGCDGDYDQSMTGPEFVAEIEKHLPTTVIFRKYVPENDIIAIFPYEKAGPYLCTCYQHIGQHGAADGPGVIADTKPATPEEYAELKREIESIGYVLDVKTRINRRKYAEATR